MSDFDEEEFEDAVWWIRRKHGIDFPPVRVVRGPLKKSGKMELIGEIDYPEGKISVSTKNPLQSLFHEVEHLVEYRKTGRSSNSAEFPEVNPLTDPIEKEIDRKANQDLAEFKNYRLEKRVRPIVERFLEVRKGYDRTLMFEKWRKAASREQLSKSMRPESPAVPLPTIKAFLRGEFEKRQGPELQKLAPTVTKEELATKERWDEDMRKARAELDANPRIATKEFAESAFQNPGFKADFQRNCTNCGRTMEGNLRCDCQIGRKGFSVTEYLARKSGEGLNG